VFNLLLLSPMGTAYDEYAFRNFGFTVDIFHIVLSCVFLAFLLAYCATIIGYISKLKEARDGSHSSDFYDGDFEGDGGRRRRGGDGGGGTTSEGPSRASSRCPSTYFNQRSTMEDKPKLGTLLEVVREAKRAQIQLQQGQLKRVNSSGHSQSQQHSQQSSQGSQVAVQPIQPQLQQSSSSSRSPPILKSSDVVPTGPGTATGSLSSSDIQMKVAETQTPPLPPAMPILHPHSQTLPHPHFYQRRGQGQSSGGHFHDSCSILTRGPRSSPSYPNVVTASVAPNRFRNPNSGLRTNAAGTLGIGRYDSLQSSGSPHSGSSRTQTLMRQNSSSLSSMDHPPIFDPDVQWEQPRIQALKYNYGYNALRRGTHRSDYGMEV